jgi:hypothetical protein
MVLILDKSNISEIKEILSQFGEEVFEIGTIK